MILWTLSVILVLILINSLYVAAEFAIVGARATRVAQLADQGHRSARELLPILQDSVLLDRYIAACQIGITLSSLLLGAFGQATLGLALGGFLQTYAGLEPIAAYGLSATLVLLAMTSIQVVFGELVPKGIALQFPVGTALFTCIPMRWSLALYSSFIDLLNGSGALVLRWLGATLETGHRHVHAPDEIELLVRESHDGGLLEDKDSERLREALRLGRHRVRQLMVPRRQIAALDLNTPLAQQFAEIDASPFTRLVVHRGGFDDIQGFLHLKDVALAIADGHDLRSLQPLVRPLLALPSSLTTDRALGQMRDRRARIALLVDEFGDVEGLISLEDIIRELLGELSDEFKSSGASEPSQLPDGRWRLPGRMPLDDAMEWARTLGTPEWAPSKAETLAGWLIEQIDAIPESGHCFGVAGLDIEIESMDGPAISSVLVRVAMTTRESADA